MLLSKTLNQNMLKIRYFMKKIAKLWGIRSQIPAILPIPTVLLQNVLILPLLKVNFDQQNLGRF